MKLRILYFASLRESLGTDREEINLPAGVIDAQSLRDWLSQRGEPWQQTLAAQRAVRVAVNQSMAHAATPIKAGDEVAFFPPVTGG